MVPLLVVFNDKIYRHYIVINDTMILYNENKWDNFKHALKKHQPTSLVYCTAPNGRTTSWKNLERKAASQKNPIIGQLIRDGSLDDTSGLRREGFNIRWSVYSPCKVVTRLSDLRDSGCATGSPQALKTRHCFQTGRPMASSILLARPDSEC